MRILGIDPGSGTTGYGIIETDGSQHTAVLCGAIKTNPRQPFHERLLKIHTDLCAIVAREKVDIMGSRKCFMLPTCSRLSAWAMPGGLRCWLLRSSESVSSNTHPGN